MNEATINQLAEALAEEATDAAATNGFFGYTGSGDFHAAENVVSNVVVVLTDGDDPFTYAAGIVAGFVLSRLGDIDLAQSIAEATVDTVMGILEDDAAQVGA